MVLTRNEQQLISYLWRNYTEQLSINELAKRIGVTPKGMYVILKKLEKINIVAKIKVANIVIYQLNYQDKKTRDVVEYALKSELPSNSYVAVLEKDLQSLQGIANAAMLFGSVLTKGLHANDVDLLVIINSEDFSAVKTKIQEFESISPKKVHLLIQTKTDMQKNLLKRDPVIMEILRKGYILLGYDTLYQFIEKVSHHRNS